MHVVDVFQDCLLQVLATAAYARNSVDVVISIAAPAWLNGRSTITTNAPSATHMVVLLHMVVDCMEVVSELLIHCIEY